MDRTAVFVDAGYLFAAGSMLIAGEKLTRSQLLLDPEAVVNTLKRLSEEITGLPLLRIYWYDGTSSGPTPQQLTLAYRPNVKLRLGFVNQQGAQKGVDSLIVMDLITLARNRAMADALLLTGDEDLRVGVQQAQEFGVRVHLLGIAPARENQSGYLAQEADTVRELDVTEVQTFLSRAPVPETPPMGETGFAPVPSSPLDEVAQQIAGELRVEEMEAILAESSAGTVPLHIDRRLLVNGGQANGGAPLTSLQKRRLRAVFLEACRAGVERARESESEELA